MKVSGEGYQVIYEPRTTTITCQGLFRLQGLEGYAPVTELLNTVADQKPESITLDLRGIRFLNSSGINTISKFVIRVRNHNVSQLVIQGTSHIPWQTRSLKGLQRLMPKLKLEFE